MGLPSSVLDNKIRTKCPVFCSKNLKLKSLVDVVIGRNIDAKYLCKQVPWNIYEDSVFVVDTSVVPDKDVSTDGIIYDEHSCPWEFIYVSFDSQQNVTSVSRGIAKSPESRKFKIKKHYSKISNGVDVLQRIITRFFDAESNNLQPYVVIAYILNGHHKSSRKRSLSINPFKKAHGNCKSTAEAYNRTNPSVLDKISYLGQYKRPKQIITSIENDAGGVFASDTPSQLPRNNMQIYNKLKSIPDRPKARNTGKNKLADYSKLIAMSVTGEFVKDASLHPRRKKDGTVESVMRTFCTTNLMMKWVQNFCSPLKNIVTPCGIDMTYKCGPFYATTMVFHHPMFVHRNSEKSPGMVAAIGTSNGKEQKDYLYFASQLKQQEVHNLVYGSDGEVAMEKAFESTYPIEGVTTNKRSIHLRCANHFETDIERFCHQNGISSQTARQIAYSILGQEGYGRRVFGLIDATNDGLFDRQYEVVSKTWPKIFQDWMASTVGKLRSNKDMLKKNMVSYVRMEAGLGNYFLFQLFQICLQHHEQRYQNQMN